ncbi:hypothetical protein LCGC14_0577760 [marine sediment metagenome]|uniref:Bacteriophage head to tail connecting protein n=1 Tax=marine sediment metagenome TaxID=412755 RepID=A0A0F9RHD5_9ZZZZ
MADILMARKLSLAVKDGFDRNRRFARARAMFIREYVGKYYAQEFGLTGEEPINLIFNTLRAMVPNLVMQSGVNKVGTEITAHRDYASLLGLGLNKLDKLIEFKDTMRGGIVDAFFLMAIFKTGLATSGKLLNFGDVLIDQGQIYSDVVDFDDFVFDPVCKDYRNAAFIGDRNRVPRQLLLDDNEFNHDLVMQLPRSISTDAKKRVESMSRRGMSDSEMFELQDFVDVVELYVPDANALLTIPDPHQIILNDWLAARDYYGPKSGPYTIMALTQPVPGNPYPIAPVGIFYDLHKMANRMMVKLMNQADRQKDIAIADPAGADEAEDLRTASDGDIVMGNPDTVKVVSFGGQNQKSEVMLERLQVWANYMSGNPDQVAGLASEADSATQASILQANSTVTIEDARGMVYDASANIAKKKAWFMHTDPFIDVPLSKRKPGGEYVQLVLTPEQRRGDFLEYTFNIKARSMSRLDPAVRTKRIIEFATNVMPSVVNSAMVNSQMGIPTNVPGILTDIADELGILEDVQDWFEDPQFIQRMQLVQQLGPQPAGKAQQAGPAAGTRGNGNQTKIQSGFQERKQIEQLGADESQGARTSEPGV